MGNTSREARLENYISQAEIAYKSGETAAAIRYAKQALAVCNTKSKAIALKIFVARAYSKIGKFTESNVLYRELLKEKIYMPPVVMGLFYNNFKTAGSEKMRLNMKLIKTLLR